MRCGPLSLDAWNTPWLAVCRMADQAREAELSGWGLWWECQRRIQEAFCCQNWVDWVVNWMRVTKDRKKLTMTTRFLTWARQWTSWVIIYHWSLKGQVWKSTDFRNSFIHLGTLLSIDLTRFLPHLVLVLGFRFEAGILATKSRDRER